MPRRAKRDLMKSLCSRGWYMAVSGEPGAVNGGWPTRTRTSSRLLLTAQGSRQYSEYGLGGVYPVADACDGPRANRQIHVHARAEPNEAEALAAREPLADSGIAQDASRDQHRDLHAGDVGPTRRSDPQRRPLVFEGRFRQSGIEELTEVVPQLANLTVDRATIGMDVENVHEYAHLERVALEIRIPAALHRDDAPIGGRQHRLLPGIGDLSWRIPEELRHERDEQPQGSGPPAAELPVHERGGGNACRQEQPPLPRDDRMGITCDGLRRQRQRRRSVFTHG